MDTAECFIEQEKASVLEKWEPLMSEWRESGLPATEWVSQRTDITYDQFLSARKNWFPEDIRKREPVDRKTEWSALSLEVPSGTLDLFIQDCRIEIAPGFDQELLKELLEVIRNED